MERQGGKGEDESSPCDKLSNEDNWQYFWRKKKATDYIQVSALGMYWLLHVAGELKNGNWQIVLCSSPKGTSGSRVRKAPGDVLLTS